MTLSQTTNETLNCSQVVVYGHCLVTLSQTTNEMLNCSQVVVYGHCLVTLSQTINEMLKWLKPMPVILTVAVQPKVRVSSPPPPGIWASLLTNTVLWAHRELFWQLPSDGNSHGSAMSRATTKTPKPPFLLEVPQHVGYSQGGN